MVVMTRGEKPRVAVVTGAGSGMGEATSLRFARDGMAVGVMDINGDAAESVSRRIREAGGRAVALQADVANRSQVEAALTRVRSDLGPVSVLVT